ncbi:hypothetical protein TomTYG75_06680 [Sphingobium sp. TomTYG75]
MMTHELEKIMSLIEERLCIIWYPTENRDTFASELAAILSRTPSHGRVSDIAERLRHSIEALGPEGIGGNVSMSYEFACDLLDAISTPPETVAAPIPVEGEVDDD